LEVGKEKTQVDGSDILILSILWRQGGDEMRVKMFWEWLHNIGYSDNELDNLPINHLVALQDEYIMLMYGDN
jgi:hypothetical protein